MVSTHFLTTERRIRGPSHALDGTLNCFPSKSLLPLTITTFHLSHYLVAIYCSIRSFPNRRPFLLRGFAVLTLLITFFVEIPFGFPANLRWRKPIDRNITSLRSGNSRLGVQPACILQALP